jgi:hypothetical protein
MVGRPAIPPLILTLRTDDDEDFQQAEEDFSALMSEKVRAKLKNAAERDGSVSGDSSDEEDADWEEEVLFESPLDKLDAYVEFSRTLQGGLSSCVLRSQLTCVPQCCKPSSLSSSSCCRRSCRPSRRLSSVKLPTLRRKEERRSSASRWPSTGLAIRKEVSTIPCIFIPPSHTGGAGADHPWSLGSHPVKHRAASREVHAGSEPKLRRSSRRRLPLLPSSAKTTPRR